MIYICEIFDKNKRNTLHDIIGTSFVSDDRLKWELFQYCVRCEIREIDFQVGLFYIYFHSNLVENKLLK